MIKLYFENADKYISGIRELEKDLHFETTSDKKEADFIVEIKEKNDSFLRVKSDGENVLIEFGDGRAKLMRAIMLLSQAVNEGEKELDITEKPHFKRNGMFLDLARNMALNIKSLKYFLRQSAIMGLNTITFYLEDLYEVENEPYFGYMRGRYHKSDFKELCAYGEELGVEIIPYVEFFSHMEKFLGYESSAKYRSSGNTFLFGDEKTYDLIERMVKSLRESFTTQRICIGGDEVFYAHEGVYREINGERSLEDVFFEHANVVYDIIVKYGFKPFLSNDMYFYFRNNNTMPPTYYPCVDTVEFEEGIEKKVPENMGKIFWNYIDEDEEKMVRLMELSNKLGGETMWLGSVRMWQSLCIQYSPTIKNIIVGMKSCMRTGIDTMAFCTFEDSGAISHFLALPAFLACAQFDYTGVYDEEDMKKKVKFLYGADYEAFLEMERADFIHHNDYTEFASLYLLYNDPLIGLLDKEITGLDLKKHYSDILADYEALSLGEGSIKLGLEQFKCMASILELKADFGIRLKAAYDSKNIEQLSSLYTEADIIKKRFEQSMMLDREMFTKYYSGFGSEKHELRKGTMVARFETVKYRIEKYLNGEIDKIDELEEERLRYDHFRFEDPTGENIYFCMGFENILTEA